MSAFYYFKCIVCSTAGITMVTRYANSEPQSALESIVLSYLCIGNDIDISVITII